MRVADTDTQFTLHLVYRRTARWLDLNEAERRALVREVETILAEPPAGVQVRGVYSSVGLRPDADMVVWLIGGGFSDVQRVAIALRRSRFGAVTELSWSFPGMVGRPEFVGDHLTAFQAGRPPLRYICLYPFVRTPDWYLLPTAERGRILREHGLLGAQFPQVYTNNVQGFGIGDYEWILSFETDAPEQFVLLVRKLREAEARRYTKLDVPFILGERKPVAEVLADLG
jgi:peroxiredoxin